MSTKNFPGICSRIDFTFSSKSHKIRIASTSIRCITPGCCRSASRALHSWDCSQFVSPIQMGARTLYRPSVRKRERAESCRRAFRAFRYLLASLAGLITSVLPTGQAWPALGDQWRASIFIPRLFLSRTSAPFLDKRIINYIIWNLICFIYILIKIAINNRNYLCIYNIIIYNFWLLLIFCQNWVCFRYITVACSALRLILRNFAPVIKSNVEAPLHTIGVDVSREERWVLLYMHLDTILIW